jgi:hypothetical protein
VEFQKLLWGFLASDVCVLFELTDIFGREGEFVYAASALASNSNTNSLLTSPVGTILGVSEKTKEFSNF